MFHLNKKPLSNNQIKSIIETKYPEFEIRNFVNQLNELSKEFKIHQFSHGTWGKLEYLDLDENEILEVISCINTFIENLDKDQFHAREICEQYIKDLNVSEKFNNYFIISAIIRERLDLQYLGRCVFSNSKNKNDEKLKINDVVVDVLNKFKKPLHATKLMEEVKKIEVLIITMYFRLSFHNTL